MKNRSQILYFLICATLTACTGCSTQKPVAYYIQKYGAFKGVYEACYNTPDDSQACKTARKGLTTSPVQEP